MVLRKGNLLARPAISRDMWAHHQNSLQPGCSKFDLMFDNYPQASAQHEGLEECASVIMINHWCICSAVINPEHGDSYSTPLAI